MTEQEKETILQVVALIHSARESLVLARDGAQVEELLSAAELSLFVAISEIRTIVDPEKTVILLPSSKR